MWSETLGAVCIPAALLQMAVSITGAVTNLPPNFLNYVTTWATLSVQVYPFMPTLVLHQSPQWSDESLQVK